MATRWQHAVMAAAVAGGLGWGQDATQEQFLTNAKIVKSRAAPGGVTNSKRVTMTDGVATHDAHVQTIDIYKLMFSVGGGTKMHFVDSYRGNVAAYKLDRLMGLGMIPVTVERKVGGNTAAVTWWVDHVLMDERERGKRRAPPPNSRRWIMQSDRMRVFDELIGNTDRNQTNILIRDDWEMVLIDHTRAFDYSPRLMRPEALNRCDRQMLAAMKSLSEPQLKRELGRWLRDMQIHSLLARRDRLVEHFEALVAAKGESEVLFGETAPPLSAGYRSNLHR